MIPPDPDRALSELATTLHQRRLDGAARVLLDIVEPVAFLASQVALFARPLTPRGRWYSYVDALCDETSWSALRRIVEKQEC